jgi:hypothetical protein
VDFDVIATYPLVPVNQVWSEVSKGNGVISSVVPNGLSPFADYRPVRVDRILINKIYLAYFEDLSYDQPYLQPIYVFEGNYTSSGGGGGSIHIYYPAVSGQYIKRAAN